MKPTALYIANGSRRQGRCGRCGHTVTWATLATRGTKNIPLIQSPTILRVDHGTNGVSVEVIAFDQVHRCAKKSPVASHQSPRPRPSSSPAPAPPSARAGRAFPSFTPDRIADIRRRIEHGSRS